MRISTAKVGCGWVHSHRQRWISKNGKKSHMRNKENCAEGGKKPQFFHLSWKKKKYVSCFPAMRCLWPHGGVATVIQ